MEVEAGLERRGRISKKAGRDDNDSWDVVWNIKKTQNFFFDFWQLFTDFKCDACNTFQKAGTEACLPFCYITLN